MGIKELIEARVALRAADDAYKAAVDDCHDYRRAGLTLRSICPAVLPQLHIETSSGSVQINGVEGMVALRDYLNSLLTGYSAVM